MYWLNSQWCCQLYMDYILHCWVSLACGFQPALEVQDIVIGSLFIYTSNSPSHHLFYIFIMSFSPKKNKINTENLVSLIIVYMKT